MSNKPVTLEELKQAEETVARMRKQFEKQQAKVTGPLPTPVKNLKDSGVYFVALRLGGASSGHITTDASINVNTDDGFRSESEAAAFAEALRVMYELRLQPGAVSLSEALKYPGAVRTIACDRLHSANTQDSEILTDDLNLEYPENALFGGIFRDHQSAKKAIDTLGHIIGCTGRVRWEA